MMQRAFGILIYICSLSLDRRWRVDNSNRRLAAA